MPLMERVREIGIDESAVDDDTVLAARRALTLEVARSARPGRARPSRRRTWTGIGIGGLVAGVAVIAIVAGSVIAPSSAPDAAAAEVLERASAMTFDAQDTTLVAGQYLRIETVSEHLQFWNARWADDDDENTMPFNASRDGGDAAVLVRDTRVLFIPADRADDWFYDWGSAEVVDSFGSRGADAAREWASSPGSWIRERGTIETLPAGEYLAVEGDEPPMPYLADRYRPYYDEMPRDPKNLLDWLRARSGMTGVEADRWLVAGLSDPSAINLMPADLRSAFFLAVALIPGFEVVAENGSTATLQYTVTGHRATTITIDTEQGLIDSISESYGSGGPAGDTVDSVITVHTSVVDSPPQG